MARKVLIVGWDAADWKVIHPLVDAGKMPGIQMLMEHGTMGDLTTLQPVLSPMLWTTIATGKRPFKHGIHGFTEPDPINGGIRPITNLSRKTKCIWNILHQQGLRSNVIGWWPSYPAEPINGCMVSDQYHKAPHEAGQPWTMKTESVHPARLEKVLAELRCHPEEITADEIGEFIPQIDEIDLDKDKRPIGCMRILAECATINNAAIHLAEHEPWDFMAVYFDSIDHFCHGFMKYHPPRQDWIPEKDYELYKDVVNTGYIFHDIMLQSLLNKVDLRETTVILVSDHGFHPDHLRPRSIPKEPAGPAAEHREHGVFLACGPGIKQDHLIHGANMLDITPTLLSLFGLPMGEDMDGAPLIDIYQVPPTVSYIPSWDTAAGDAGTHPPDKQISADEARAAVDQLVALGYVDKPSDNQEAAVKQTVRELDYNVARAYVDAGQHLEAIKLFEKLYTDWPLEHRFGVRLAMCYQALGRTEAERQLVETLLQRRGQEMQEARKKLEVFHEVLRERKREQGDEADQDETVFAEALQEEVHAQLEKDALETPPEADDTEKKSLMSEQERVQYWNLRSKAQKNPYFMHYMMGNTCFNSGEYDKAMEHLTVAKDADPRSTSLHNLIGQVQFKMQQFDQARGSFNKVLKLDPKNPDAFLGLARISLTRKRYQRAATMALNAIGLRYAYPLAHFVLGQALQRMRRYKQAADAMEMAIEQNPNLLEAHRELERLYSDTLHDPERAAEHTEAIEAIGVRVKQQEGMETLVPGQVDIAEWVEAVEINPPIDEAEAAQKEEAALLAQKPGELTIVSGLPRSGTSMMMQMLEAGGLPILTDGVRQSDEDNPKGYYEYEKVKALRTDRSWLPEADGKATKIIAQLLPYLPPKPHKYKIIFMQRELDEVLSSQEAMLQRNKNTGAKLPADKLKAVFVGQIQQVKQLLVSAENVDCLYMDYHDVLNDTLAVAKQVSAFLGGQLDANSMAGVVDKALYRHR